MQSSVAEEEAVPGAIIVCGTVALDPQGWLVRVNGRVLSLTLSEFVLLKELMLNAQRFLDRATLDQVLQRAHGQGFQSQRASLRSVDIIVSRLRRKLQAAGCDAIETMRRVGYRFLTAPEPQRG